MPSNMSTCPNHSRRSECGWTTRSTAGILFLEVYMVYGEEEAGENSRRGTQAGQPIAGTVCARMERFRGSSKYLDCVRRLRETASR
jgi:hypothetical protein